MAHCSSVPTGGAPALHCLQQHASQLSAACQQAVSAIKAPAAAKAKAPARQGQRPPPAPARKQPLRRNGAGARRREGRAKAASKKAQLAAIGRACGADYRTHCHGIRAGHRRRRRLPETQRDDAVGGLPACAHRRRGRRCRQVRSTGESTRCCSARRSARCRCRSRRRSAPAPVEPPPLLVSPREEMFILRTSCRGDYVRFCRGLRFGAGPGRILPALQRRQPVAALPGRDLRAARRPLRQ